MGERHQHPQYAFILHDTMGLASKLATIQAAQGAYNQYSGAKPPGSQTGYGAQPGYGGQPQQQYGQPASYGQSQQPYGAQPGAHCQPAYGQQSAYGSSAASPYGAAPQTHQSSYPGQAAAYGAAGAAAGAYGAQQYGQHQASQYGQQQPGQYGQQAHGGGGMPYPGAPGAGQYGGQSGGNEQQIITEILDSCVRDQKIQSFYPPGSTAQIAARIVQTGVLNRLASEWRLPKEVAFDVAKLALFDVILYLDDSGSMRFEEGGSRIDDLKLIVGRVAFAASLFDSDGINVRFMNDPAQGNNITSEQQATQLVQQVKFSGLTPLGTALRDRVINPLVIQPARAQQLRKPVLIVSVTDGAPAGESRWEVVNTIKNAVNELRNTRYGPDTLSFQFAQVGNDIPARDFLQELDANHEIGSLIDCTSNYELEADQARKTSGIDLSPELWLVKLLLGPIDSSYDSKDEKRH